MAKKQSQKNTLDSFFMFDYVDNVKQVASLKTTCIRGWTIKTAFLNLIQNGYYLSNACKFLFTLFSLNMISFERAKNLKIFFIHTI